MCRRAVALKTASVLASCTVTWPVVTDTSWPRGVQRLVRQRHRHRRSGNEASSVHQRPQTTLLKILSGELRPTRGTVRHGGRFGYCPQHVVLNEALTVRQHLTFFRTAYRLTDVRYAEVGAPLL